MNTTAEEPKTKPAFANLSDLKVFVVGPFCWGAGKTYNEALENARKNGGSAVLEQHNVFVVHPSTGMDGMGSLYWGRTDQNIDFSPWMIHKVERNEKLRNACIERLTSIKANERLNAIDMLMDLMTDDQLEHAVDLIHPFETTPCEGCESAIPNIPDLPLANRWHEKSCLFYDEGVV